MTPRERCAAAIEIALAEIAADRGCQPDDLSVRVLRAIEGAALECYRLGGIDAHDRPTVPERESVSGLWCDEDERTPAFPYR